MDAPNGPWQQEDWQPNTTTNPHYFPDRIIRDSEGRMVARIMTRYTEHEAIANAVVALPKMLDLLHRNLDAWEDEEESVQEEHHELIAELRKFLEGK